ncbi:cardiolipin synthase [Pararobbsia alpina]|uniref:cardiolipin synthase n=1 Tax=Pararobbsia alpina TaxID=621374 RepID=UPI0039A71C70
MLGVLAAFHAIANARTSQGAIAWAVALIAMPYLTVIPYLFLGSSRFAGYVDARRLGNQRMRTQARDAHWAGHADDGGYAAAQLGTNAARAMTFLADMPFVAGNSVTLLVNGRATFDAIFDAIDKAEHYIAFQFFIVRDDPLGWTLRDKLIARAAAGVKIYFLYDGIGSYDLSRSYVASLREGGVDVREFSTRKFINRFQINFRNHRKIVVVDGLRAFIGGHNVGVEYLGEKPPLSPWRDTHIELRGPAVANVQFAFLEDWYWVTQRLPDFQVQPVVAAEVAERLAEKDETVAHDVRISDFDLDSDTAADEHFAAQSAASGTLRQTETHAQVTPLIRGPRPEPSPPIDTRLRDDDDIQRVVPLPPPVPPHEPRKPGYRPGAPNMRCQVIATGPADRQETASLFFVEAINSARHRIWITTPYFIPDEAVSAALRLAVMRGVDVRIMIPSRRDHFVVFEASMIHAHEALKAGIRIYRYRPGFLHQKVMLIDDRAASVGTANLDNRSFRLNFELIVLAVDRDFASKVEAMLAEDFAHCFEIDRTEYSSAPAWRRLTMTIARLFSPIL